MTDKSEWQRVNRRLMAEQQRELGEPPTSEEMLAYSRGEMTEAEEERIRDLLVAYPELARVYGAAFPDEDVPIRRERTRLRQYVPTSIAAALALVFFGLYVQAEGRARQFERQPVVLGSPHELQPGGSRGLADATELRKDGEAYLLKPKLADEVRYAHYRIELYDRRRVIWTSHTGRPDVDGAFQIVIPHDFLRAGEHYRLRISGVDGEKAAMLGAFDLVVPAQ